MPGVYKEKACPTCGGKHRKKGIFCSKVCSNKGRDDDYKQKMRDKMLYSEEGQMRAWSLNWDEDSEPIVPPVPRGLDRNQFISGGDIWTTVED
jgi:hypothetical protein